MKAVVARFVKAMLGILIIGSVVGVVIGFLSGIPWGIFGIIVGHTGAALDSYVLIHAKWTGVIAFLAFVTYGLADITENGP